MFWQEQQPTTRFPKTHFKNTLSNLTYLELPKQLLRGEKSVHGCVGLCVCSFTLTYNVQQCYKLKELTCVKNIQFNLLKTVKKVDTLKYSKLLECLFAELFFPQTSLNKLQFFSLHIVSLCLPNYLCRDNSQRNQGNCVAQ